jgi:DNA-binding response OmpR family regulator
MEQPLPNRASEPEAHRIMVGDLIIDLSRRTVHIDGRALRLSRLQFDFLVLLASNRHRVVPYYELSEQVWGCKLKHGCTFKQLHNFVKVLRRKIEPDVGSPRYIINSHGVGYFMPMEVDSLQADGGLYRVDTFRCCLNV